MSPSTPLYRAAALALLLVSVALPTFAITHVSEIQLVNQTAEEIEPTLMSYTHFGVEYNCSVWMNYDPTINATSSTLKYTAWTSTGSVNSGATIPTVAGYNRYADPYLVKHPTMTRIFLVGLALDTTVAGTIRSAVVVWYSANGGWNWSSPHIVATATRTNGVGPMLDKTWAATAPDGKLWITYISASGSNNTLLVHNGTLSGSPATWSWSSSITVPAGTNTVSVPQIAVDSDGDVYVLFVGGTGGSPRIGLHKWDAAALPVAFSFVADIPSVTSLNWFSTEWATIAPGITLRAATCPIMKLDRTRRRIAVVWHQPHAANRTRLQLATMKTDVALAWSNVTLANTGGYDLQPSFDFNSTNGDMVVSWYAFPYQSSSYYNTAKKVTFVNNVPTWVSDESVTNRMGDISTLTADASNRRYLGEYHDVVYTNGNFKAVKLIVAPQVDPWVFTVTP